MGIVGRVTRVDDEKVSIKLDIPWPLFNSPAMRDLLGPEAVEWVGPPPEARPNAIRRSLAGLRRALPSIGGATVFLLATAGMGWGLYCETIPPLQVGGVSLLTPIIYPGEELKVQVRLYEHRQCITSADRHIMNGDGLAVWHETVSYRPNGAARGQWFTSTITVKPPPLPPGRYFYSAKLTVECNIFDRHITEFPAHGPLPFEIINNSST